MSIAEGLLRLADRRIDEAVQLLTWAYDELLATNNRQVGLRVGLELSNALFLANSRHKAFEVLRQVMEWAAKAGAISFVLERPREFHQLLTTAQKEVFDAKSEQRAFLEQLMIKARSQDGTTNDPAGARGPKQALTERERSIIEFIAGGQSNKQIARALGVTPETVKTHVKRIFIKLSAESRAQAVVRAQSLGFLRNIEAR